MPDNNIALVTGAAGSGGADIPQRVSPEWHYGQVKCPVHKIAETANGFAGSAGGWELATALPDPTDPEVAHLVLRKRARNGDDGTLWT